jgi:DNA adenine methylase
MEPGRSGVPPIKCQGIKTKLAGFILSSIRWDEAGGRWIEPFLGSGVVALNLAPRRALLADVNQHIITLYRGIQRGEITGTTTREHLQREGVLLAQRGEAHYYAVRERFNAEPWPLDLLFLSHACFNGMMRFNRAGGFNVPFCRKPERFSRAYITRIANKVEWAARQMAGKEWEFRTAGWGTTLTEVRSGDFVYLDPPYIGRHTEYHGRWDIDQARDLARATVNLPCGYALSMWLENHYRRNPHIEECWSDHEIREFPHFYHLGASERLRHPMQEALVIRPGFANPVV